MIPILPAAVPEIPVADLVAATHYYRDRLGFAVDWVGTDIDLGQVSRDQCRLFLAGPAFRAEDGRSGPVLTWLNLHSNDAVDALHGAWSAIGALLVSAPESKPWGLHEFIAEDPDGNRIRVFHDFATPARERSAV